MRWITYALAATMVAGLAGCNGSDSPSHTEVSSAPAVGANAPAASEAPHAESTPASAGGADTGSSAEKSEVEKKYDEMEAKLAKNTGDAKLKAATAQAAYEAGHYIEYDKPGLSPREKYRPALKLYNRALALDPKHADAAKEKKQIEDIYTQMGMPIPK